MKSSDMTGSGEAIIVEVKGNRGVGLNDRGQLDHWTVVLSQTLIITKHCLRCFFFVPLFLYGAVSNKTSSFFDSIRNYDTKWSRGTENVCHKTLSGKIHLKRWIRTRGSRGGVRYWWCWDGSKPQRQRWKCGNSLPLDKRRLGTLALATNYTEKLRRQTN